MISCMRAILPVIIIISSEWRERVESELMQGRENMWKSVVVLFCDYINIEYMYYIVMLLRNGRTYVSINCWLVRSIPLMFYVISSFNANTDHTTANCVNLYFLTSHNLRKIIFTSTVITTVAQCRAPPQRMPSVFGLVIIVVIIKCALSAHHHVDADLSASLEW